MNRGHGKGLQVYIKACREFIGFPLGYPLLVFIEQVVPIKSYRPVFSGFQPQQHLVEQSIVGDHSTKAGNVVLINSMEGRNDGERQVTAVAEIMVQLMLGCFFAFRFIHQQAACITSELITTDDLEPRPGSSKR